MKDKTNWYWYQQPQQHTIIFLTRTIIYPRLDAVLIINVQDITKSVCNVIQVKKSIQRHPICLTDADYDFILD